MRCEMGATQLWGIQNRVRKLFSRPKRSSLELNDSIQWSCSTPDGYNAKELSITITLFWTPFLLLQFTIWQLAFYWGFCWSGKWGRGSRWVSWTDLVYLGTKRQAGTRIKRRDCSMPLLSWRGLEISCFPAYLESDPSSSSPSSTKQEM